MVAEFPLTTLQKLLINGLELIPQNWALTPLRGNKAPYRTEWQHEPPLDRKQIITEIGSGAEGYGIRTGRVSGGIVAIDFDGSSAMQKASELSGGEPLPDTVSFTSNRPGREQRLYLIPQEYWGAIKTIKIKTGVIGDDGKPEQLELRWDGCQSVLPPSVHPTTGHYHWHRSPQVAIAPAPKWVIEAMLAEPEPKPSERYPTAYTRKARTGEEWSWSDEEWALSYLSALNPCRADDYEDWLAVGMALHSVGDSLLTEWDNWSRQSSKYTPGCCEKKWKSFKRQGVAMGTLAHKAKQDGWRSPFEKASVHRNFGSGSGSGGDGGDALTVLSLRDRVLQILNQNQDRSQRDESFINLAQTSHITTREIKELAASLETEVDLEESRSDRKAEIENLLRIGKYQLELQDYLDPSVAYPLERVAGWMGATSAAMLTTLYPVIGSLLQVGTRLELIKATNFYALPIVYAGLICESGGGKSPAQKTIINPLFALQDEAEIKYKERLLQYQKELTEWKKNKDNEEPAPEQPVPREYYTTDATSEAIALIQSQQPNHGFLGWFDELPALFKSQGQYKNGRGADGEKILSGRDGTGFKVNRASGKRLVVSQSAYSITGSLQPLILRQMMGDFTDANGQWARFLWTVMQVQPAPYPDDAIPFDVFGLLKGIYRRISKLAPQTYKLSPEAQKKYRNWYNKLDQLKMSESRQGLRAVYSKMKGDTGVLALLLHCFNGCVLEGSVPNPEVSEQTMAAAIKLAKYHIGQVKLIHSEGDVANGDIAAIHAKIIQLSERKGWLKAADVRDIDRQTKKQFTADDIRRHFQELETSGFGQTKGEGTRLMWSIYKDSPPEGNPPILRTDSGQTQDKPESTADISVQPLIGKILDKTQDNSGQTQDSQSVAGSISNISVQPLLDKTQDTQDTFEPANTNMDEPVNQKQIKSDVLSFSVLSCPELVSKSCDSITVSVSAQNKTQDNCPETVLSCPELEEGVKEVIAVAEAKLPIYQRSDGGFEVELGSLKGWEEALAKNPYPHVDVETAKANSLAMREVFTNGNYGDFQDLFELYSDKEINWVCAWLHDYQPTLHARIVRISAD
jgi:CRISPR-associated protein Cmr3